MPTINKTILTVATEHDAHLAVAALETLDVEADWPVVVGEDGTQWTIEIYDDGALTFATLDDLAEKAAQAGAPFTSLPRTAKIPNLDWVSETQKSLKPVRASRFIIHGSHDRAVGSRSKMAIEIEAGRAFGTAHHGSTRGCLLAIDRHVRNLPTRSVLDLGTGSGVLAIAAIKMLRHRASAVAVDIDPIAVEVAQHNARINGVAPQLRAQVGDGTAPALPFDLVIANILAKPLLTLAGRIRALTCIGGITILAGFTTDQAREIIAAYRARGYNKLDCINVEGWTTAVLKRAH